MTSQTSSTPEQTKEIATQFAHTLTGGEIILLSGDLGSGKTTFVQGLAKALGYDGPVRSPTFTLVNVYPASHAQIKRIVHVDLYRLTNATELPALALEEYHDEQTVLVVEWPDLLGLDVSTKVSKIQFVTDGDLHKIIFSVYE